MRRIDPVAAEAAQQLLPFRARALAAAHSDAVEVLQSIARAREADVDDALQALVAAREARLRAEQLERDLAATLVLGRVSVTQLARALGVHRVTLQNRLEGRPEAHARGEDLERVDVAPWDRGRVEPWRIRE
ncbi:hypothetical protein [Tsukamurella soli]|uniref:Helix-turn-helix domain-containing protein n=1 Tax=Tsukamurella soli TaxID=644556 RepID=A0ABP8J6F7_9ACTN